MQKPEPKTLEPMLYETFNINGHYITERRSSLDRRVQQQTNRINLYDRRQTDQRRIPHVDLFI
ncbi:MULTISPECIES: hypothetical protein [unclassified Shewanella]|uniref:hypothetical protein n=1 Tax=unclassified Shewanella TaxID=196818 RepID=UPI001BC70C88|nr:MULTISPECIES: hypothetical protein [unclassified Shewanella]GIU09258.1 hypothetical protein TUM4444_11640 [Shewanella sp. MBTL60-112-B1]GIU29132.1 hypothetical protein TUM4445_11090 [Shewanella sp. MBTL60-112-B2]